jgi:AcrR family transcriptional regulator
MEFQRARSDHQRHERRRAILATAQAMLTQMPVAKLSLNELSRRVGLAKSNVLRYFESREAILLELLDAELADWTASLDQALGTAAPGSVRERVERLARVIAQSLAPRPVMCDLISAQSSVLEHNISTDVALRHKRATAASVHVLVDAIQRIVPELSAHEAYQVVATTLLMTSAAWPQSQPPDALRAAYAADPTVAAVQLDFTTWLRQTVELTTAGLLARHE